MIMDHYRVQHSSSGNDDASLSLVPSGRYMVELSKFFCKINWLLLSIYTLLLLSYNQYMYWINTIQEKKTK